MGLEPDGIAPRSPARWRARPTWWTRRGPRWTGRSAAPPTAPLLWIAIAYFCGLFAWYAVQVHQTKVPDEIGFNPSEPAWRSAS